MGKIVIACYRPKPGHSSGLRELMKEHRSILESQDLVTDRQSIIMEAKDGTVVEVFEWISAEAVESAHSNPVILEMWQRYEKVCDYIPIGSVPEATELFSSFSPFPTTE